MTQKNNNQITDEAFEYALELGKKHKEQLWQELPKTEKEWLGVFPEAKGVIATKIIERKEEREKILGIVKKKLQAIRKRAPNDYWFWREFVKADEGERLFVIDKHIKRLYGAKYTSSGQSEERAERITELDIQQALNTPIQAFLDISFKKTGNKLRGRCPFHEDKTPSFYAYLETNSFYCFGCGTGGNIINLVRMLYGLDFKKAVGYLNRK